MNRLLASERVSAVVRVILAAAVVGSVCIPGTAAAQWSTAYEQFYHPGRDNWVFRSQYPAADRLFNAFDYGHAILYELLYTRPGADPRILEENEYNVLTRRLLISPPRLPLKEVAIMPHYTRLAPEAKQMFEWAHILHRQVYDVLADERLDAAARDARLAELMRYYRSRRDVAFSTRPKTMALMQEQYYSLAFRERYPKFNGLIWGYHWLQVGLYEPLVTGQTREARQAGVASAVARFRQMLGDPPTTLPYQMPITSAIAPTFATRYPELAIIFDNLHSMHDVISDILVSEKVPRHRKRAEILLAAARFRDDTTEVMSVAGWRRMAEMMGLHNMGGPATGLLGALPTPTVPRGFVMRHDRDGNMIGEHAGHDATPKEDSANRRAPDPHAGHVAPAAVVHTEHQMAGADSAGALATVEAFHAALAAGDSLRVLSLLSDDVVMQGDGVAGPSDGVAGPGDGVAGQGDGVVVSRASYRRGAMASDIARARALPVVRRAVRVRLEGHVAWVTATTSSRGTLAGRPAAFTGAELVVLLHGAEGWRITSIHRSSRRTVQ